MNYRFSMLRQLLLATFFYPHLSVLEADQRYVHSVLRGTFMGKTSAQQFQRRHLQADIPRWPRSLLQTQYTQQLFSKLSCYKTLEIKFNS